MEVRCLFTVAFLFSLVMPMGVTMAAKEKTPEAPMMSTVATLKLPPHDLKSLAKLRSRASQDDPQAQYDLATLYLYGRGVDENSKLFEIWMSKAGANGHYLAQKTLGTFLAFGYGEENNLRKDEVEGLKWLLLAKEHEPAMQGCEAMAVMLKRKMPPDQVAEAERRVTLVKAVRRPVR